MAGRVEPRPKIAQGTRVGPYEIVRSIGSGGHAEVFLVQAEGRFYALKMAHHRADGDPRSPRTRAEERILREHAYLARLNHPNIVRVHGYGRWPEDGCGWVYLVEELVEGTPLTEWRERATPTLRRIVQVAAQLARAVHDVHQHGLFHRDLKSRNVLVSDEGHLTGKSTM